MDPELRAAIEAVMYLGCGDTDEYFEAKEFLRAFLAEPEPEPLSEEVVVCTDWLRLADVCHEILAHYDIPTGKRKAVPVAEFTEDEARELLEAHGKDFRRGKNKDGIGWWVCDGWAEQTLRDLCTALALYDPPTGDRKAVPDEL